MIRGSGSPAARRRRVVQRTLAVVAIVVLSGASRPCEGQEAPASSGWRFSFEPLAWLGPFSGTVAAGASVVTVDLEFKDFVENVDLGTALVLEATRGLWGVSIDLINVNVSRPARSPVFAEDGGDMEISSTTVAPAIAYAFVDRAPWRIAATGGARIWIVNADLFFDDGTEAIQGDAVVWTDPTVGVGASVVPASRWTLRADVDVGGFGVGSKVTWQAGARAGYRFGKTWQLEFGYRALSVDYSSGGFVYDVLHQGFVLGAAVRFQ